MIAATALAHNLPLYTLNSKDLRGLEDLIEIVDVGLRPASYGVAACQVPTSLIPSPLASPFLESLSKV
jgi:hypothetical protein